MGHKTNTGWFHLGHLHERLHHIIVYNRNLTCTAIFHQIQTKKVFTQEGLYVITFSLYKNETGYSWLLIFCDTFVFAFIHYTFMNESTIPLF